jgi:hypothetical protein
MKQFFLGSAALGFFVLVLLTAIIVGIPTHLLKLEKYSKRPSVL